MPKTKPPLAAGLLWEHRFEEEDWGVTWLGDERLAVHFADGLRLFEVPSGRQVARLAGRFFAAPLAPGRMLSWAGEVIDADGRVCARLPPWPSIVNYLSYWPCAFSPDGSLYACSEDVTTLSVRRTADHTALFTCDTRDEVDSAAFSRDGTLLVAARTGKPLLYHPVGSQAVRRASGTAAKGFPRMVRFSPDGALLLDSAERQKKFMLREGATGTLREVFTHPGVVASRAFVADGRQIVAVAGRTFLVLSASPLRLQATLAIGVDNAGDTVVPSSSGARIALCAPCVEPPKSITVWDVGALRAAR